MASGASPRTRADVLRSLWRASRLYFCVTDGARATRTGALVETPSDEQLMDRYQAGDARAFEILLRRHGPAVQGYILRTLGDPEAARDLVQEVFLRIVKSAGEYQRRAKFTTWMYTIARNLCIDAGRRRKFRRTVSLDQPTDDNPDSGTLLDTVSDPSPLQDRLATGARVRGQLEQVLARMNPDQRDVFVLREFQGLSFKEIAEMVGSSENTVKSRMRYALETLRAALAPYADAAGP